MYNGATVKKEPIKTEEVDFVENVDLYLENVIVKCERIEQFPHLAGFSGHATSGKTTICSESEYLAEGYVGFESIIVKEEPKLTGYGDNLPTTSNAGFSCKFSKKFARIWECYVCRRPYGNVTALRKHIRKHVIAKKTSRKRKRNRDKIWPCDQCDRKYANQYSLRHHQLIHSGIKPHACDVCDRKFSDSSTLYKHKQIHTGEKPYVCELCDRRCARKLTLDRHLRTHTGEKLYTCELCGKKFSRNSTLNHHKLIHTGENPFECNLCDRKFKMRSALTYHLQSNHSTEKSFVCDECNRKFFTKTNLNQHKKTHKHRLKQLLDDSMAKPYANVHEQMPNNYTTASNRVSTNSRTMGKAKAKKKKSKFEILMNKCKSLRKI